MAFLLRLLPYRRFSLETSLPPAEVLARLEGAVEPRKLLRVPWREHKLFEGRVAGDRFELKRIIDYRNSFLPRVRGGVEPTPGGARLVGTMAMHPVVMAFMVVWLGGVAAACAVFVPQAFAGPRFEAVALLPLGMFAAGFGMMTGGFLVEARRARRLLIDLIGAREAPP